MWIFTKDVLWIIIFSHAIITLDPVLPKDLTNLLDYFLICWSFLLLDLVG